MRIALRQSYANWLLLVIVSLPPLCTAYLVSYICAESNGSVGLCKLYFRAPLLCVNLLWFLHVDLTFYVISLIQVSWLLARCLECACMYVCMLHMRVQAWGSAMICLHTACRTLDCLLDVYTLSLIHI